MKQHPITAMHVCYLSPNQTGYETRVVEETSLLQKEGINVIIACFVDKKHFFPKELYERLKKATNARIYIIPTSQYFDISIPHGGVKSISWPLIALAKLHKVQILHGQALYSTMHALRVRERIGAKVVFDVHGASPDEEEMSGSSAGRIKTMTDWEQEALQKADFRIYVSNRMKHFFEAKYNLPSLPHIEVPCCVHSSKFSMTEAQRRAKRLELGIDDKFVIAYLGTLSVWQWPDAMFSLFSIIKKMNPKCFFGLFIPKHDHEKAKSFIDKYNIPNDSFFLKEVPHSNIGSFLGAVDAGLLLRKFNPVNLVSSPTKFGEYLAAGVPVIATDGIGDTSEFIHERQIGLIIPVNSDTWNEIEIRNINDYLNSVEKNRTAIAKKCCEFSNNFLSWEKGGRTLADTYASLVA